MAKLGPRFEEITEQLSKFKSTAIYSCDETRLFLKVLSIKTLAVNTVRGKVSRDARVPILLCCNAEGSHKRTPFVLSAHRPKGLNKDTEEKLKTNF
ncbi:hypothetical protein EDD11_005768 [Mortierella claussenii]|nr:hypothetical protein EDD11_005768 [Mortierella claussenii]